MAAYLQSKALEPLTIWAQKNIMKQRIELAVHRGPMDADSVQLAALTFSTLEEGAIVEPTLCLSAMEASRLMDELWNCGVRPTDMGSAGQLGATQKHLEDMRKIAFSFLEAGK